MKLAREFTFKTIGTTVYRAKKIDTNVWRVTYEDNTQYGVGADWSEESVRDCIKSGSWIVQAVLVDGDGNPKPDLKEQIDASELVHDGLTATSLEVGDDLIEGTFEAEMPHVYGEIKYVNEAEEGAAQLTEGDGHCSPYVVTTDCAPAAIRFFDEQTVVGAELEAVRRFCEENEGWYVEVDADFYAVKNYDHDDVVFTVANEAQLAEVMQAIRTLNKYEDRG